MRQCYLRRPQFDDQMSDNGSCGGHIRAYFILWFPTNLNLFLRGANLLGR
jgi:hypothetical protein